LALVPCTHHHPHLTCAVIIQSGIKHIKFLSDKVGPLPIDIRSGPHPPLSTTMSRTTLPRAASWTLLTSSTRMSPCRRYTSSHTPQAVHASCKEDHHRLQCHSWVRSAPSCSGSPQARWPGATSCRSRSRQDRSFSISR
jgi:hypothetical protein